ncbi:hypothetical protein ALC57_15090, partial [Trachymyrmex cornetzi]
VNMFSVVDFPDEEACEVIPTSWLTDGNQKTFYPEYKATRFWKAVTTFETPKPHWKTHSYILIKAKSKRDQYQYLDTDGIQTGTDVTENQTRKLFPSPWRNFESRSHTEDSQTDNS